MDNLIKSTDQCTLQWLHNGRDSVSNTSLTIVYSTVYSHTDQRKHQSSASLAFVQGNSPGTGEFPAQMASNMKNVSIWWRHHEYIRLHNTRQPAASWLLHHVMLNIVTWHRLRAAASNIKCTKSQNLNVSRFVLPLSLPNPFKSGVKSRMKI